MIRYYRLFDLLNRRGMKKTDLLKVISSPTLAKLSKHQYVTLEVIDKICIFLECQPEDIMEHISKEEYEEIENIGKLRYTEQNKIIDDASDFTVTEKNIEFISNDTIIINGIKYRIDNKKQSINTKKE